jgi:c-di-GMP-binding flagellar brake protein YcgR
MKERRLYKRHTARFPARLEPLIPSNAEKIYRLETKDISIGGAFIYIKDSSYFPQGTRFIMDFTIPKDSIKELTIVKSLMECTGSLVRSTSEGIAIQCDTECKIMNIRGS